MNRELLRVENLSIAYGDTQVVKGIDFSLRAGETLALVGESGSGKSQTAHALLRLLPGAARLGGSVRLDGEELLALSPQALLAIRGQRIGMVFQEPMTSLNPLPHRPPGRRGPAPASPPAWRRAARAGTGTARTGRPSSRDACSRPIRTSSPAASDSE